MSDELDRTELALLEVYRVADGPTPEVEDRLLSKIQAQAAVEDDLASDDETLLGAENEEAPRKEARVRPLMAASVALVAFAAGIALMWGLRSEVARSIDARRGPATAAMTTQRDEGRRVAKTTGEACDPIAIDESTQGRRTASSREPPAWERHTKRERKQARDGAAEASRWEPVREDEPAGADGSVLRQRTVASAPWASKPGAVRSRSTAGGGYVGPAARGSGTPRAGGVVSVEPRSATANGSRGGNNGGAGPPTNRPSAPPPSDDGPSGGNAPPPGQPPTPRPPTDDTEPPPADPEPQDPDRPEPADPQPTDDGQDDDSIDPADPCEPDLEACESSAMDACQNAQDSCEPMLEDCAAMYEVCLDPGVEPVQECLQIYNDCYMDADAICIDQEPMPVQCEQIYEACEQDLEDCTAEYAGGLPKDDEVIDGPEEPKE